MGGSAHSPASGERKREMRAEALARRAGSDMSRSTNALLAAIVRHVAIPPSAVVACVWPLPGEPDLRPLLPVLHARGQAVVLPETPPRGQPLLFRRWVPGCTMLPGRFGTCHPDGDAAVPHLAFVPLLAFDSARNRLGYGGGYYDRTLAMLQDCQSVGFGLAAQQVEAVPCEPHDRPLDMVVTEQHVFGRGRDETQLPRD